MHDVGTEPDHFFHFKSWCRELTGFGDFDWPLICIDRLQKVGDIILISDQSIIKQLTVVHQTLFLPSEIKAKKQSGLQDY